MIHAANTELQIFQKSCTSNKLTVNLNKTFYLLFTIKPPLVLPPLFFSQDIIQRNTKPTLLGIIYDDTITFKNHITNHILKLSRLVSLLYLVKEYMPTDVLRLLMLMCYHTCTAVHTPTYLVHYLPHTLATIV